MPGRYNAAKELLAVPDENIEQLLELAMSRHQAGQLADAEALYRRILQSEPQDADVIQLLGMACFQLGRREEGLSLVQLSAQLNPQAAECHYNLGTILSDLGRHSDAILSFRQAVALKPDYVGAFHRLGLSLRSLGQWDEAEAALRRTIELCPAFVEAHNNLATVLRAQGDVDQSITVYHRALEMSPDRAEIYTNLGNALKDQGNLADAIASYRRATELQPDNPTASSNLAFALWYDPKLDSAAILEGHRQWDRRHAQPLGAAIRPHDNDRDPNRRLKIGYVSADFRGHAAAFCLVPLLAHHDHAAFEVFCYSGSPLRDAFTDRLTQCADTWRECSHLSDEELAATIRADGIDLLMDLSMHTSGNRLLAFARKPAPVQVCWLAHAGTTGLEAMDYRLTDPYLDPPGQSDSFYSERSVRLPDSFWCFDPLTDQPLPNPTPALQNGFITFGCLNNFCKVNDGVLSLWSKVLKAVPHSRLLLNCPDGAPRQRVRERLEIAPDRLLFVARQPRPLYLQTYHRIDLCLDTLPYNGAITSLEALWMGVPVLSQLGRTVVGRAGWSLLSNLGLSELCAGSEARFVQLAVAWAGDLPRLANLRATLRDRLKRSPLMDAARFARNVEAAYRAMWRQWCASA
ncbi:MAG: tetratricopeptide repeat protein [Tepidisphaeraceae bacterium]